MRKICYLFVLFFVSAWAVFSQQSTFVDDAGVFRWTDSKKEVRLFGANYTLPFAHGFRAINYLGKDHKKAIDEDVYHMTRLGLDAFRIHVWDTEISDSLGNVIPTNQLDLLDYTLAQFKGRGFKTIVTPFKVGDNGYPEKSFPAPGFSANLEKYETYDDEVILQKQERYFEQFLNHVNPYTGLAYKDDPDIIALEINNEPRHDNAEVATKYINRMVDVIRKTGFKNPIFYNVAERHEFVEAYCEADIQGCTFQWYPTGLVYNKTLNANFLPNVDVYNIPFENLEGFKNKARIIYEFDPADMAVSYLYPAMARSFREAKFQFATQFAYEPLELAFANTEYQTHYLNLLYTPSKAISLLIASHVFHDMENGESYGRYPKNLNFGHTKLDTEQDRAEYLSDENYFYTNGSASPVVSEKKLKHIAGVGSSSAVKYSGTGAYFLDKIEKGVWRLEVMPDYLWVKDPFEKASLDKTVAVIQHNEQAMTLHLEDLGNHFSLKPLNAGNDFQTVVKDKQFNIVPGTYLIQKKGAVFQGNTAQKINHLGLTEFVDFRQDIDEVYVVHQPQEYALEDQNIEIEAQVVAPDAIENVAVVLPSGYQKTDNYNMNKTGTFTYKVSIPNAKIHGDAFRYYIVVKTKSGKTTYPNQVKGSPEDWDFIAQERFETFITKKPQNIVLFDANKGMENTLWPDYYNNIKYRSKFVWDAFHSTKQLQISVENLEGRIPDFTFKILVDKDLSIANKASELVVKASSGALSHQKVQVALQMQNGAVFGTVIDLPSEEKTIRIPLKDLKIVKQVVLPRAYPVFQPYWFQSEAKTDFDATKIEAIQCSIGPGLHKNDQQKEQKMIIDKIFLN